MLELVPHVQTSLRTEFSSQVRSSLVTQAYASYQIIVPEDTPNVTLYMWVSSDSMEVIKPQVSYSKTEMNLVDVWSGTTVVTPDSPATLQVLWLPHP